MVNMRPSWPPPRSPNIAPGIMLIIWAAPAPRPLRPELRETLQGVLQALHLLSPATQPQTGPHSMLPPPLWQKWQRERLSAFVQWKEGSQHLEAALTLPAHPAPAG